MQTDRSLRSVATAVVAVARENGLSLTAAGLSFYMFNSLIPLVLFVIVGVTAFDRLEGAVALFQAVVDVDVDRLLSTMHSLIGDGAGRRRAALLAAGILGYSTFTMFQSVNMAFGVVYGSRKRRSLAGTTLNSLLILTTVLVAVSLSLVVGVTLAVAIDDAVARAASVPLLLAALFGAFVPMYYRFAAPGVTVRESIPGAAAAAVVWTACGVGFRVYVVTAESVRLYGVAGGVMLLLTCLYLGSLGLLLGAVLNAVLADRVDAEEGWLMDD